MSDERALRIALIEAARRMNASGLNQGTSGNLSVRAGDGYLITPSAIPYDVLKPDDIVRMRAGGTHEGTRRPSTEWRFHRDIYAARPEVQAVVHAHPLHATALACLRREIPAFHYMVAVAGGTSIRVAPYATFGTEELSRHAVAALEARQACLLANHGMIAVGPSLERALYVASEVETLAAMYLRALAAGEPAVLSDEEMAEVLAGFQAYGRRD